MAESRDKSEIAASSRLDTLLGRSAAPEAASPNLEPTPGTEPAGQIQHPDLQPNKQCACCHQLKPHSQFHKASRNKDGLHSYCKECNKARVYEWQSTAKGRITVLRQGAGRRGIPLDLTIDELDEWWSSTPDNCEYCGCTIVEFVALRDFVLNYDGPNWRISRFKRFFRSKKHAAIHRLGIDRRDNSRGYCVSNIAKCCWFCNSLKNDFFSESEMKVIAPGLVQELKEEVGGDGLR